MCRKLFGLLAVLSLAMAALGLAVTPASAQGNSGKAIVIKEVKHDKHASSPDDQLPYPGGQSASNHEKVLRQTHAPGIMRKLRDPALQTSTGPTVATTSGVGFAGVGANGWAPPDTNGAAGLTQYVQWVNVEFAAFNKSNGSIVYGPAEGNSIWSGFGGQCQSNNSGDIIAQFDKQAGVWVMMQAAFTSPYTICIAVSTTATWTSSGMTWNRYAFPVPNDTTNFPDYPKLSVWPDGYYLSYNSFTNGNSWAGPQACVMNRAAMLAGTTATMQCMPSPGTSIESMLPSDLDGAVPGVSGTTQAPPAGSPAYYVGIYGGSNAELALFKFHVDWTTPSNSTFTGPTYVSVSTFNEACGGGTCIPQPNTTQELDSLADRLMYRLAYRNFGSHESLVVSHSVDPGTGQSGIRWYEIRSPGSSPTVFQQGTFAPSDTSYRWMPSIAMDKAGDIAVGYSESSSTVAPSIFYTGRQASDPAGTMESEAPILNGAFSQTSGLSRWGDYSAMSVDPADDCTFWYTNEYLPSNGTFNWATQIASFVFPGCSSPPGPSFTLSPSPSSRTVTAGNPTSYTINVNPSGGFTGDVTLGVTNVSPSPSSGSIGTSFVGNPVTINSPNSGSATLNVTTTADVTPGTYTITVQGTNGSLNPTTSVTLVVNSSGPPPDFGVGAASGTITVPVNSKATDNITVTPSGGFTGNVSLSLTGLPSQTSSSFSVNPVSITGAGSGSSVLTISTNRHATQGTYSLLLTATSGSLTHMLPLTLVIGTPPNFSLSASPSSQTVVQGSPTSYTVTVTPSGGFTGTVGFGVTGLPSGAGYTLPSVSGGSGNSTLNVTTSGSTPTGSYPLTITGTSGSLTHTASVTLVVNAPPTGSISLSPNPGSVSISRGKSGSSTITVQGASGFSGSVTLTISGLPSKVTGSFSPNPVTLTTNGSAGSSLTITVNKKAGTVTNQTLTITGRDSTGTITNTTTILLTIT